VRERHGGVAAGQTAQLLESGLREAVAALRGANKKNAGCNRVASHAATVDMEKTKRRAG
jgi:hypothetical protein